MPEADKLTTFSRILMKTISLDDREWSFKVEGLPSPGWLDQKQLVKKIAIRTDMAAGSHSMTLGLEKAEPNRAIKRHPLHNFVLLSVEDFRPLPRKEREEASRAESRLQPAVGRECADYIVRFLRAGVTVQDVEYNFYGHSNSQLKSRSCFLYAARKDEISRMVESLGDFRKMKTVGKKAKRIGLLFSSAQVAMQVPSDRCEDIPDVETIDYVFTDGCGLIAPSLARELARRVRIIFRDVRYTPSVFQIRYRGYKGVVTVDPRMNKGKALLKMRNSMKKFSGGDDDTFAVVEHSKPYSYGFLNDETILLLDALGVPRSVLFRKQDDHFALLSTARTNSLAAFRFLSQLNKPKIAEKMLVEGLESVQPQIRKLVNAELGKMLNKREEQRCRIFVQKSRLLFGVCDAWDVLKEGECAVKVTMEGDGVPYALRSTEVAVIRNPCLHPGDWQKFKVVERPELAHLVDCIVFPVQGRRPAADMMSGGDLDGDQFFVCWDQDMIPSTLSRPALYPPGKELMSFMPITDDDRLVYFARYRNTSLGRVKNLYLDWAKVQGPISAECQELNRLFSQSVDGNRIRIPKRLEEPPAPTHSAPPFILDELHERAQAAVRHIQEAQGDWDGCDLGVIDLLLCRDDIAMSEFEFVRLTHRWCERNSVSFGSLLHYFDLNALTDEEKAWVLGQVPLSVEPSLVLNALYASSLLSTKDLNHYQLGQSGIHWKRVYDSERGDRLATFLDAVATNLEVFHKKLIIIRPDERLTLAIYIPRKVDRAQDCLIDDSARLFAFPHSQGPQMQSRLTLPTKMTYRLYSDENVFQLFQNQRANSWVFMARPGSNDADYRNIEDQGHKRRKRQETIDRAVNFDVRASIALDKFSKGLQKHIGRVNRSQVSAAEIYVISNRDVKSMKTLDLWLEYVATGDTMPLNQQAAKDYAIPQAKDMLSPNSPDYLVQLVKHGNISALSQLRSVDEFNSLSKILLEANKTGTLLKCFDRLLEEMPSVRIDAILLLEAMLDLLQKAPPLVISFGRCDHYDSYSDELLDLLHGSAHRILRAFILSANEAEDFVLGPLRVMLSKVPDGMITKKEFAGLVELISLTVRSPDVAMDILLGALMPESSRLLTGDPDAVRYLVDHTVAIALEHIGEACDAKKKSRKFLDLMLKDGTGGYAVVEIPFRVDAPGGTPENSSHVRLTASELPKNVLAGRKHTVDALVTHSEQGLARLTCFHPLPSFYDKCSWDLEDCGPFVTTRAMFDAVLTLTTQGEECCQVAAQILGQHVSNPGLNMEHKWKSSQRLNESQNAAVEAALCETLTCLWGPPGTGKTETVVEIIRVLQENYPDARVLVTAPTHAAVDNAMRRYARCLKEHPLARDKQPSPLRISTDIRKVAEDLRNYTCDAMAGKELHSDPKAMAEAKKRVSNSEIVFTTCIGSAIGLLRAQEFQIVIVDEASQQTEPASIVPLVKGCAKAILVGDHVQLRPTVAQYALPLAFDVSLFERLYTGPANSGESTRFAVTGENESDNVKRLMLDTQYRMHPRVSAFSSNEFYGGKLKAGIPAEERPLFASCFPWPQLRTADYERMIFVECDTKEKPGQRSKENQGQSLLCAYICRLLTQAEDNTKTQKCTARMTEPQSVAVLTPYAKQAELLRRHVSGLPGVEVSSIDGFQGREADIVVFVTVRCNESREIGFLRDLRRINVVLTRARAGLVVVGHRETLTGGDDESARTWGRLLDQLTPLKLEIPRI